MAQPHRPPRMNDSEILKKLTELAGHLDQTIANMRAFRVGLDYENWGLPLQSEAGLLNSEVFIGESTIEECARGVPCRGNNDMEIVKSAFRYVFSPQLLMRLNYSRKMDINTVLFQDFHLLNLVMHKATSIQMENIGRQPLRRHKFDDLAKKALDELRINPVPEEHVNAIVAQEGGEQEHEVEEGVIREHEVDAGAEAGQVERGGGGVNPPEQGENQEDE